MTAAAQPFKTRFRRIAPRVLLGGAASAALAFALSYAFIEAPLGESDSYPAGTLLYDRKGTLMRVSLGPGDVDCRPVYYPDENDWIVKALVASEDKRFFKHGGADLKSLARAVVQNVVFMRRVSGASTITEQTARLIEPHPRTLFWKYVEFFQALKLERARSKEWIVAQYLNRAPFGSNFIGIEAASQGYFGKDPHELSLSEASLLAGLVQAPSRFRPDKHLDRALKRRDYVLSRVRECGYADDESVAEAAASVPKIVRAPRPFLHPHYCDWILADRADGLSGRVDTPLDPEIQRIAESFVSERAAEKGCSAAAVVADAATGEIIALACSGDYFSQEAGQVNTALAPRPAGSVLKPFFHARALERGLLSPAEALPDVPRSFGSYAPVNFDRAFRGCVNARDALVESLNMPALEIMRRIGVDDAIGVLRGRGFKTVEDNPDEYGLGLAIGNAEIRLVDLAEAYASFARDASVEPAAWLVTEALSGDERTFDALGHSADVPLPRAAWKTGTSAAHRDAWTALWTPRHVVATWCGYIAGRFGDKNVTGANLAAPLAWKILRAVEKTDAPWFARPEGLATTRVCTLSGMPATGDCPETREEWSIKGVTPTTPCTFHVHNADGGVEIRYPKDIEPFMRRTAADLTIVQPTDGSTIELREGETALACRARASSATGVGELYWFLDGVPIGSHRVNETFARPAPKPGEHALTCTDGTNHTATIRFTIQ